MANRKTHMRTKNDWLEWLLAPHSSVTNEVVRTKSRLLAIILGAMCLIFFILDAIYVDTLPTETFIPVA